MSPSPNAVFNETPCSELVIILIAVDFSYLLSVILSLEAARY